MYEGDPDEDDEEQPPIYIAEVGDDGGLRGAWMDTAEYIADTEESLALWLQHPVSLGSEVRDGHDHAEPGFLYLGDRDALAFIAEMVSGIVECGQAFAAWARHADSGSDAVGRFKQSFLGRWESVDQFVEQLLKDLGASEGDDPSVPEGSHSEPSHDPAMVAQALQQRGAIRVIPNPNGGVWVFRAR